MIDLDTIELRKIASNRLIYAKYKRDYFEIADVLEMLNVITLPVDMPINNNMVFIRDITHHIVYNDGTINLEPNIVE